MLAQQVSQHSGMDGGGAHKPPALAEELLIVQFSLEVWPPVVDHTPVVGPTPLSIWASLIGLSELF